MTHDPLCPMWSKVWAGDRCDCELITKVREDMLAKCIEAVEALSLWDDTGDPEDKGFMGAITETLDALRALEEKP